MHAIEMADRLKCNHLQGGLFTAAGCVGQPAEGHRAQLKWQGQVQQGAMTLNFGLL